MKKFNLNPPTHIFASTNKIILILIFLTFYLVSVKAQNVNLDTIKLNTRILNLVAKYHIPDPQIVVFRNDSIIYEFSGNRKNERNNYLIGSCSKSFTALSVMMLAEKKKIDIDKPVKVYLPWFTLKDDKNIDQITVRHLLNHTSGIASAYGFFDYKTQDNSIYKSKLIEHLSKIQLISDPGKAYCYSNLNYLLLGLVVESAANEKYLKFLTDNVFPQIGMNSTYAGFNDNILEQNIQPYQYYIFQIPFKSKFYAHSDISTAYGYLSSNTKDLKAYVNFMIHQGITENGDTLINTESYQNLITPVQGKYGYGMGWISMNNNGVDMLFHTGLDENYSSILTFCPDNKLGVIVLSNVNSFEFCSFVQSSIIDMIANKPFFESFSLEIIMRWVPGILVIVTIILLLFNIFRWKKYSFKIGIILMPIPLLRLIFGIVLSLAGIILIHKIYNISVFTVRNFQPDIVWCLILVLVFGIISSFLRHFGTYSKGRIKQSVLS